MHSVYDNSKGLIRHVLDRVIVVGEQNFARFVYDRNFRDGCWVIHNCLCNKYTQRSINTVHLNSETDGVTIASYTNMCKSNNSG